MQALRPASRFSCHGKEGCRKGGENRNIRSRPQVPSLRSPVPRLSSVVLRHCEAPKGLWQSAIPVQTPVSRPPSFVSRPKVGNPMGAEPPWSSGRESRGDRLEIGPLWRFLFPVSFPLKETGSRRSAKIPRPVPVFRPRRSIDLSTASRSPSPKGEAKRKGHPLHRLRRSPFRAQGPLAGMRALPPPMKGRLKGRQKRLPFRGAGAKRLRGYSTAADKPSSPVIAKPVRTPDS